MEGHGVVAAPHGKGAQRLGLHVELHLLEGER